MAAIRSRKGGEGGSRSGASRGSLASRGDRLLRRRSQQRTPCLGVVVVFLALVVLVVVATVQTTLKAPPAASGGGIRRSRNAQHLQQHHNVAPPKRQHLLQDVHDDMGARYSDSQETEEEEVQSDSSKGAPVDRMDEPEEYVNDERHGNAIEDSRVTREKDPMESEAIQEEADLEEEDQLSVLPEINFCDFVRRKPGASLDGGGANKGYSNPAVVVLGMEDTSADLVWHVLNQIIHPDHKSHRVHQLTQHATAIDYVALGKPQVGYKNDFWSKVSTKSRGKWIVHVFCQQREHDLPAGFTWLSSPDVISKNEKAQDTFQLVKDTLPQGSVKILRIRRNYLDVLIRHTQKTSANTKDPKVTLDQNRILAKLANIKAEQAAVDMYLEENDIPHLELDFEMLFPFDHWTDLVQVAQVTAQKTPVYLNSGDSSSKSGLRSASSQLESAWREVLEYIGVTKPLSLLDILQDAMRTHKVNTFWNQKDTILNYPHLQRAISGTQFEQTLRRQQMHLRDWGEGDEM